MSQYLCIPARSTRPRGGIRCNTKQGRICASLAASTRGLLHRTKQTPAHSRTQGAGPDSPHVPDGTARCAVCCSFERHPRVDISNGRVFRRAVFAELACHMPTKAAHKKRGSVRASSTRGRHLSNKQSRNRTGTRKHAHCSAR